MTPERFIEAYTAWRDCDPLRDPRRTYVEREELWREYCEARDSWVGSAVIVKVYGHEQRKYDWHN